MFKKIIFDRFASSANKSETPTNDFVQLEENNYSPKIQSNKKPNSAHRVTSARNKSFGKSVKRSPRKGHFPLLKERSISGGSYAEADRKSQTSDDDDGYVNPLIKCRFV